MSELGRSGADKDLSWKAFDTYIPSLLADIKVLKKRTYDYKHNHPAINAYIQSIEVSQLQTEARLLLNKSDIVELEAAE